MSIKDSQGREVDILVSGHGDEIEIEYIQYVDSEVEVPDSEVDFIMDAYAGELEMMALERAIGAAEAYYEGER